MLPSPSRPLRPPLAIWCSLLIIPGITFKPDLLMSSINALTRFLTQADTQFQLFDMGRQVRPLASDLFVRIEQQQEPYPGRCSNMPGSACTSSSPLSQDTTSWFLKFALDEARSAHLQRPQALHGPGGRDPGLQAHRGAG